MKMTRLVAVTAVCMLSLLLNGCILVSVRSTPKPKKADPSEQEVPTDEEVPDDSDSDAGRLRDWPGREMREMQRALLDGMDTFPRKSAVTSRSGGG
jgi:hypothetical protein